MRALESLIFLRTNNVATKIKKNLRRDMNRQQTPSLLVTMFRQRPARRYIQRTINNILLDNENASAHWEKLQSRQRFDQFAAAPGSEISGHQATGRCGHYS